MSFFQDSRYRQERIFLVFTIPALLIATVIVLVFLSWKKDDESRREEPTPAAEVRK